MSQPPATTQYTPNMHQDQPRQPQPYLGSDGVLYAADDPRGPRFSTAHKKAEEEAAKITSAVLTRLDKTGLDIPGCAGTLRVYEGSGHSMSACAGRCAVRSGVGTRRGVRGTPLPVPFAQGPHIERASVGVHLLGND